MEAAQWDVWLAGEPLEYSHHVCGFFRSPEEAYGVLLPFIKEGIDRGDRGFHLIDSDNRADHFQRLAQVGIDAARAEGTGLLEVRSWSDFQFRSGQFDQHAMLALLEEVLVDGKARGFNRTRLVANMEWSTKDVPGVENLLEFETRVNYLSARNNDPLICTYDLDSYGAGLIVDILRTHPYVIIGRILQQNPFFVPPDEMLLELRERPRSVARSA
jgi:MEDS: MEthanogen/methylotroph, DcmR Sensory domain